MEGKTLLATGTLENFPREEIKESIINNGGKYASSVSKKLDYLIVGDKPGSSKIAKATELGVKMITESEYLNMIKNENSKSTLSSSFIFSISSSVFLTVSLSLMILSNN